MDLTKLDGSNGFVLRGIDSSDNSGTSVSSAGDVNNDGIDDLIIGAPEAESGNKNSQGESYVVFGSETGFSPQLNLAKLDGSNGFKIRGINRSDRSGSSVSSAGDVNNDGIDDLIIGAPNAGSSSSSYRSYRNRNEGESYVVFGRDAGFPAQLNLAKLDGSNGFKIRGINRSDRLGTSVSSAGDVNNDGIDDLIIGAPYADSGSYTYNDRGASYVVFGSEAGFSAQLDLTKLDGSNGFVINGINRYDRSGTSVSSAGDVNDDGIDDLIIGAPNNGGETYVVFGSKTGFSAQLNLANPNDIDGFVIKGNNIGRSISGAGDVNGDGVDDLIVGAPNANSRGASYVIFGVPALKLIGTDEDDILDGGLSGDFLSGLGGDDQPSQGGVRSCQ